MYKVKNKDLKIIVNFKEFFLSLDNHLENIPTKDKFYKDKIREICVNILLDIIKFSNDNYIKDYYVRIKSNISLLDFLLERMYNKKYIGEKGLFKLASSLGEINKMLSGFIKYRSQLASQN